MTSILTLISTKSCRRSPQKLNRLFPLKKSKNYQTKRQSQRRSNKKRMRRWSQSKRKSIRLVPLQKFLHLQIMKLSMKRHSRLMDGLQTLKSKLRAATQAQSQTSPRQSRSSKKSQEMKSLSNFQKLAGLTNQSTLIQNQLWLVIIKSRFMNIKDMCKLSKRQMKYWNNNQLKLSRFRAKTCQTTNCPNKKTNRRSRSKLLVGRTLLLRSTWMECQNPIATLQNTKNCL